MLQLQKFMKTHSLFLNTAQIKFQKNYYQPRLQNSSSALILHCIENQANKHFQPQTEKAALLLKSKLATHFSFDSISMNTKCPKVFTSDNYFKFLFCLPILAKIELLFRFQEIMLERPSNQNLTIGISDLALPIIWSQIGELKTVSLRWPFFLYHIRYSWPTSNSMGPMDKWTRWS